MGTSFYINDLAFMQYFRDNFFRFNIKYRTNVLPKVNPLTAGAAYIRVFIFY